eukprot:Hpha_TRINITY_DN10207_c0_g2::TRINITY_DN10207_c0_g2_i1::g.35027::m.35027
MTEQLLIRSGVLSGGECETGIRQFEGHGKGGSGGLVLFVQTWSGGNFCIELDPCATVADLKLQVQEAEGTPAGMQRLVYMGAPLSSNQDMLADYGVCPESVVHLEAGADDAVVELRVTPGPCPDMGTQSRPHPTDCGPCAVLRQHCGQYRRVPPTDGREIDKFVRVKDTASPEPCTEMLKHVEFSGVGRRDYRCSLGERCWFWIYLREGPREGFIRRSVKKGVTVKGGLSVAEPWEFYFGPPRQTFHLWQDTLLAQ